MATMRWPKRIAIHGPEMCSCEHDGGFCAHALTRDEPALYPDERIYILAPVKRRKRKAK